MQRDDDKIFQANRGTYLQQSFDFVDGKGKTMSVASSSVVTIILSLQTLYSCISLTIAQYIYAYYLQTYPNSSNSTVTDLSDPIELSPNETNQCAQNHNSSDSNARLWAQEQSADLYFWINLMSSFPLIVMTYILGLYASKLGKRFLILLPISGAAIQMSIWLALIYLDISYVWWLIGAIIESSSGSSGVLGIRLSD
jgi:hypothetical protein